VAVPAVEVADFAAPCAAASLEALAASEGRCTSPLHPVTAIIAATAIMRRIGWAENDLSAVPERSARRPAASATAKLRDAVNSEKSIMRSSQSLLAHFSFRLKPLRRRRESHRTG